jgi:hypothetical protein
MPGMEGMSMANDPVGVPMDRMGSGTAWQPEAVTLPTRHWMPGAWDLMFQGIAFAQFDDQGSPSGGQQFGSLNWAMLMATHDFAGGRLQLRSMFSLDALGVTGYGYPQLLQSGEEYQGAPLHDRQHPHDAFMELGVLYEREISKSIGISFYAAPSGEPALGPVAFMMRSSAMDNPFAPLGHHWQDATHDSFGVVTAGLFTHRWKIEGSLFNGRESDDQRWNFDPIVMDSWTGRVSFAPDAHWSTSASFAYLKSPEALNPLMSEHRASFSLSHATRFGKEGSVSSSLVWGENMYLDGVATNSVLVESEAVLDARNSILARAEFVQKTASDLSIVLPVFPAPQPVYGVSALSLGYVREVASWKSGTVGVGAVGTLNVLPESLHRQYGSTTPVGAMIFLRVRPR